jgi:hypothetical protein
VVRSVRKLSRWTRPCSSRGRTDANIDPAAAWAGPPSPAHAFNAQHPNSSPEPFLARFWRSEAAPNSGQTNPSPIASTGGRSGQSGTLMGATGGTQTHSRRTRSKLRQLRYARQGLVRVPESNTKYGGKRRKTGVASCPLCRQVSVSPQGFPSEKNCFERANFSFVPLFTGQLFILPEGLLWRDSGEVTRSGLPCPAGDGLGRSEPAS